jgi:hypothetical protein
LTNQWSVVVTDFEGTNFTQSLHSAKNVAKVTKKALILLSIQNGRRKQYGKLINDFLFRIFGAHVMHAIVKFVN